ncbi:hypothetical protein PSEUDO8Z_110024 [Pseudomonas sp. 8Z]|nr:hypothetical protein PSEUDO8Z_110024 [Pseudomonas sp. 8Z]
MLLFSCLHPVDWDAYKYRFASISPFVPLAED